MRFLKGSAMMDYIIPTAIVGLVAGLAMYNMVLSGSLQKFFASSVDMKIDQSSQKGVVAIDKTPFVYKQDGVGPLGGTPDVPVKACKDGNCSIDFGSYILSGVPESIPSVEETSGGFGEDRTRIYASVLENLADSIQAQNPEQAARLDLLASVAKSIADKQNYIKNNKDEKISKSILVFNYSRSTLNGKKPEEALYSLGVNGVNQYKQAMVSMPDNPSAPVSNLPKYSSDFKNSVLDGDMNIDNYLVNKPAEEATLFFGLWNDVLGSSLSPEVKNAVNASLSGIADLAAATNVSIEEGGPWYNEYKKLRGNMDKGLIPTEDILTSLMGGSSKQFSEW